MERKQGKVTETVSAGGKKESANNEAGSQSNPLFQQSFPLEAKDFESGKYSKVSVGFGLTLSLGNYEFARIDVTAEDFCSPGEKKQCADNLAKFASDYVFAAAKDTREYIKSKSEQNNGRGF